MRTSKKSGRESYPEKNRTSSDRGGCGVNNTLSGGLEGNVSSTSERADNRKPEGGKKRN